MTGIEINPGEALKFYCGNCDSIYEVARDPAPTAGPIRFKDKSPAFLKFCPFCGDAEFDHVSGGDGKRVRK